MYSINVLLYAGSLESDAVMHIVISLGLCGMMPNSSTVALGNIFWVCWGWWSVFPEVKVVHVLNILVGINFQGLFDNFCDGRRFFKKKQAIGLWYADVFSEF